MKLDALCEGQYATVQQIELDAAMRRRLVELGLIEGTKICTLRKSRSASVILVRGTMLALRQKDLHRIGVELCD